MALTQTSRNNLVRNFSLEEVKKYVNNLSHDNIAQMNSNDLQTNLGNIRTVAVQVQTFIHGICGKITESMKLYDLKLKEIAVLDKKIKEEKRRLSKRGPSPHPNKSARLRNKLKKEKHHANRTVKNIVAQHAKLIKAVEVYNKGFVQKHRGDLKALLTNITLGIKTQMRNPFFQQAYKQFMVVVFRRVQNFTPDQLKNPEKTARRLIHDYFNKFLADLSKKKCP